jgi:RNA polymerase sigma-70 factor (ECF subfamily)
VTEKELIEKAKRGDQDAFGELVLLQQNKVYSLCDHMVNDRDQAEDLAQEAFLKAWRSLPSFREDSSFSTWMHRLTTNICLDYLRKQIRHREVEPAVSLDDEESGWVEPADPEGDPHQQLERSERGKALARALRELPDHHRQLILMREVSGMRYQEIAAATGADLGTVKSRLARAREQLKKILLRDGNFFPPDASNPSKDKNRR